MSTSESDKRTARRTTQKQREATAPVAAQVAAEATRRAKNAGAKGPAHRGQMSKHQKRMRDRAVMASVLAGEPSKVIAKRWGITARSVDRIAELAREQPQVSALVVQPVDLLDEVLRAYRQQVEDAAESAVEYAVSAPAASIAAQRLRGEAWRAYVDLLRQVGKLPANLELFRSEAELTRFVEDMMSRIAEVQQGTQGLDEFMAWLRQVSSASPARQPFDVEAAVLNEGEAA